MKSFFLLALVSLSFNALSADRAAICAVPVLSEGKLYVQTSSSCPDFVEVSEGVFTPPNWACLTQMTTSQLVFPNADLALKARKHAGKKYPACFVGKYSNHDFKVEQIIRREELNVEF